MTTTDDPHAHGQPPVADASPSEPATTEPPRKPTARERRHGRNGVLTLLGGAMSLAFIGALVVGTLLYYGSALLDRPGPATEAQVVTIPEGAGAIRIAQILDEEGVLPDVPQVGPVDAEFLFVRAVQARGVAGRLKQGEYEVPAGASVNGLVDLLTSGKAIQHRVTIPEGLSSFQVVERLAEHEVLEGPIPAPPPEGSVRPETYVFPRGTTRTALLERMVADQQGIIDKAWAARAPDLPVSSKEELVTLASIVEKETGIGSERPHVASVFVNRLKRGMPLQSDPTIIYGINQGRGSLGRGLRRSEIDAPTPYNTYTIPGLPPGPIANPGEAALMATAQPLQTDDLYFVADGTGGHVFAETYEQHLANVAQWRRIEQAQRAAQASGGAAPASGSAAQETENAAEVGDGAAQSPGSESQAADARAGDDAKRVIVTYGAPQSEPPLVAGTVPAGAATAVEGTTVVQSVPIATPDPSAPAVSQPAAPADGSGVYAAEGSPVPLPMPRRL